MAQPIQKTSEFAAIHAVDEEHVLPVEDEHVSQRDAEVGVREHVALDVSVTKVTLQGYKLS